MYVQLLLHRRVRSAKLAAVVEQFVEFPLFLLCQHGLRSGFRDGWWLLLLCSLCKLYLPWIKRPLADGSIDADADDL